MQKLIPLLALSFSLLLSGCTSNTTARRVLEENGYTNISVGGYAWLACHQDDVFATSFTAKAPAGNMVSGAVCSGYFSSTIRFK